MKITKILAEELTKKYTLTELPAIGQVIGR